jgi:hypothetical protein
MIASGQDEKRADSGCAFSAAAANRSGSRILRNEMVKANAEGTSVVRSVLAIAAAPNRQLLE